MKGRWLIVFLVMVMLAHHLSAAVEYELVDKQRVLGARILNIYPQGIRFLNDFNAPYIPWTQLTTNSVREIWVRLQGSDKQIVTEKTLAEQNAIVAAIRARLNHRQASAVPGGLMAPAAQPGGPAVVVPGVPVKGISLPRAPEDELPKRPSLMPKLPKDWNGMPAGFVPLSDPKSKRTSLFGSLFGSPIVIFFYLLILGANFYLAREVADSRRRPRTLVCGLSFLAPFIVPLVFMLLPVPEGKAAPSVVRSRVAEASINAPTEEAREGFEPQVIPEEPVPQPVFSNYYHRDQVKFNRNFFITELMRFNRSVPIGEWLVVRTNNEREYWAGRIVKADEEGVTFSVAVGEIWAEQTVRYYQINEIFIQPAES